MKLRKRLELSTARKKHAQKITVIRDETNRLVHQRRMHNRRQKSLQCSFGHHQEEWMLSIVQAMNCQNFSDMSNIDDKTNLKASTWELNNVELTLPPFCKRVSLAFG